MFRSGNHPLHYYENVPAVASCLIVVGCLSTPNKTSTKFFPFVSSALISSCFVAAAIRFFTERGRKCPNGSSLQHQPGSPQTVRSKPQSYLGSQTLVSDYKINGRSFRQIKLLHFFKSHHFNNVQCGRGRILCLY